MTETVTDSGGLTSSKSASVTVASTSCGGTVLCSGTAVALPSVAKNGVSANYTIVVPAGKTSVVFTISGGTGDADMYVKLGSAPTSSSYGCRPYQVGQRRDLHLQCSDRRHVLRECPRIRGLLGRQPEGHDLAVIPGAVD